MSRSRWMRLDLQQILIDITEERERQDAKFGPQRHQDSAIQDAGLAAYWYGIPTEHVAKANTDRRFAFGSGTWADILVEEVAEVVAAVYKTPADLREELVQVAAVAVAWIEDLDSR